MTFMRPESFARWSPNVQRQDADFTVRLGVESDIESCLHLVAAIGAGEETAWQQTLMRTVRDGKQRALFVAEAQGKVVGYGRVVFAKADPTMPNAAPSGWYLLGLVVDHGWRRRGIGEALTRARMTWVAQRADQLWYFTAHENRASQALHQRLGFVKMAGSWVPPGGRPEDARHQEFHRITLNATDDDRRP
jgi:ribosomal protein S18 acetylase RimI-like enzyme